MLTFTILATILSVQFPVANAFVLMALAIPTNWVIKNQLFNSKFNLLINCDFLFCR